MNYMSSSVVRGGAGLVLAAFFLSSVTARAQDYTSPTLGTQLDKPSDLQVQNPDVLNQFSLPDGRVLLEVSAAIQNLADGIWSGVLATGDEARVTAAYHARLAELEARVAR